MPPIAVIDFETTGLSPAGGHRATEIAIVLLEGTKVVGRFESLMNAGRYVSRFIEEYTGISNEMVRAAPPAAEVMAQAVRFVQDAPLVAHNASFDQRFWVSELRRLGQGVKADHPFACTMLLARRLYPQAHGYGLGALAHYHSLPDTGRAHRAMADAETAAALFCRILGDLRRTYGVEEAPHDLLVELQRRQRRMLPKAIDAYFSALREAGSTGDRVADTPPIAVR